MVSLFSMRKCDGETVNHQFCLIACMEQALGQNLLLVGVCWVMPKSVEDLNCTVGTIVRDLSVEWSGMNKGLTLCADMEGNELIFKDIKFSLLHLKVLIPDLHGISPPSSMVSSSSPVEFIGLYASCMPSFELLFE